MKLLKFFKSHFEKKYFGIYRHAKTLFIFDIILLISAIFLFSASIFLFFWTPSIADKIQINFSYSSEKIVSGQDLEITMDISNNSKFAMENAVLSLRLPTGFTLKQAKNNEVFNLNSIPLNNVLPGAHQNLAIIGQIVGNITENDKILAVVSYEIGKTGKNDKKEVLEFLTYAGSEVKSNIEIQKSAFPDKEVPFTINLANLSQKNIAGIYIALPTYAKISQKMPVTLAPEQTITIQGNLIVPKTIGEIPFSYEVLWEINGQKFIQQKEEFILEIQRPEIGLKIIPQINFNYLEAGDNLPLHIIFENLSGNKLQKQVLLLKDVNKIIDLPATAKENGIKYNDDGLIIDGSARQIFSNANNLKSDKFLVNLKIKETAGFISPVFSLIPEFSAELFESQSEFKTSGNELNLKIASQISVEAVTRYFTLGGDQVGRGPLPPQAGQNTKYWIYVDLKNGANSLANFNFTAKTGENTVAGEKQSVSYGDPLFLADNLISWHKDNIEAFTTFGLYFEVSTTPKQSDEGDKIILLENIQIEATDTATGKKFEINLGSVTNKLE